MQETYGDLQEHARSPETPRRKMLSNRSLTCANALDVLGRDFLHLLLLPLVPADKPHYVK